MSTKAKILLPIQSWQTASQAPTRRVSDFNPVTFSSNCLMKHFFLSSEFSRMDWITRAGAGAASSLCPKPILLTARVHHPPLLSRHLICTFSPANTGRSEIDTPVLRLWTNFITVCWHVSMKSPHVGSISLLSGFGIQKNPTRNRGDGSKWRRVNCRPTAVSTKGLLIECF